jgi:hypothetical protein
MPVEVKMVLYEYIISIMIILIMILLIKSRFFLFVVVVMKQYKHKKRIKKRIKAWSSLYFYSFFFDNQLIKAMKYYGIYI